MTNHKLFAILLLITSMPFAAWPSEAQQTDDSAGVSAAEATPDANGVPEPQQTPDMVEEPGMSGPAPVKGSKPPMVPMAMDPREKALFQAVYAGKLSDVEALVTKGAPVNFSDAEQRTPLILAA